VALRRCALLATDDGCERPSQRRHRAAACSLYVPYISSYRDENDFLYAVITVRHQQAETSRGLRVILLCTHTVSQAYFALQETLHKVHNF
jgi:hypothetical protein